jgi:hypothetical protein
MQLLTKEFRQKLPPLHGQHDKAYEAVALVKFFLPGSSWTWYASGFDGTDTFFGVVAGVTVGLGYFSLAELQGIGGKSLLPVERDLYYTPKTLGELLEQHRPKAVLE